jgi:uncharacterized protein YbbC (DUF1343 family)
VRRGEEAARWCSTARTRSDGLRVEGPVRREERFFNFICWGPVPVVHGMTAGELARLYAGEMKIACDLTVVPAAKA